MHGLFSITWHKLQQKLINHISALICRDQIRPAGYVYWFPVLKIIQMQIAPDLFIKCSSTEEFWHLGSSSQAESAFRWTLVKPKVTACKNPLHSLRSPSICDTKLHFGKWKMPLVCTKVRRRTANVLLNTECMECSAIVRKSSTLKKRRLSREILIERKTKRPRQLKSNKSIRSNSKYK
jgi:hypothetical protein